VKGWLMSLFSLGLRSTHSREASSCIRQSMRDQVHDNADVTFKAIAESKLSLRASERSLRVANDAIAALEESRHGRDQDAAPS